ncbi:conserved hypothetical protein [Coccidioides posadasii str. Silveira]|uniref:Uncharacterized protein n=1 Tax=Coccidioides posadasii (strain RMSCC 757 / Silveira) TaxID=443226 RepID=E9DDR4_COCPS|nr:conserved hypothetical protein [Coccidioides posadasii str. Silveira]
MSREGASSKRKHGMQEDSQLYQVQEARATEQKRSHRCQFSSAAATGEERSVQLAGQAGPRFTAGIQGARGAEQATHKRGALPTREWLRLTLSKHKDEADVRWPVIGWDALARCRIGFKAASEPPCTCRAAIS